MALTLKQVERALPYDLYEKIVLMKLESERKANPARNIIRRYSVELFQNRNPYIDLTPKDYIDLRNHLLNGNVTFLSFRNIIRLLQIMKARARYVQAARYIHIMEKDMKPCKKVVSLICEAIDQRLHEKKVIYNRENQFADYTYNFYSFYSSSSDWRKNYGVLSNNKKTKMYAFLNQVFNFDQECAPLPTRVA